MLAVALYLLSYYGLKIHSVGPGLILVYDITLLGIKINNNFINIHRNGIVDQFQSVACSYIQSQSLSLNYF